MKRKPEPEAQAPLWMCTFGDLMSLLLCFFIMLFAISIISEIKWESLVEANNKRLGWAGSSPQPSPATTPTAPPAGIPEDSRRSASLVGSQPTPGRGGDFPSPQSPSTTGSPVNGGLVRFELGSYSLTDQAKVDLDSIFPTLRNSQSMIVIQGYVGPAELAEGIVSREHYLAYYRALSVKQYLVEKGLREEYFQIGVANSATVPNRAVLPPNTDPRLAGASAAVYLLSGSQRH